MPASEVPETGDETMKDFIDAASEVKAMALEGIQAKVNQLEGDVRAANRHQAVEKIREAVLADVDTKVSEMAEELWKRGQHHMVLMQQRQKEKSAKLMEDVASMTARQRTLEAENERLKQAIVDLAGRFSILGAVFGGKAPSLDVATTASTAVSGASPLSQAGTAELFSPFTPVKPADLEADVSGAVVGPRPGKPLAEVPKFPFPAAQPPAAVASPAAGSSSPGVPLAAGGASAVPLSLADTIDSSTPQQTPQRTPLSLVNSLSPVPTPEAASPFVCAKYFSFTLRKADGADLGLSVSHHERDRTLRVEGVRPEGAVEAWNRQCHGGPSADKIVMPGDTIIQVNNIAYDPPKMLEECKDKQLLKLTVLRGTLPSSPTTPAVIPIAGGSAGGLGTATATAAPSSAAAAAAAASAAASAAAAAAAAPAASAPLPERKDSGTALRADASVFVPMGSAGADLAAETPAKDKAEQHQQVSDGQSGTMPERAPAGIAGDIKDKI